MKLFLKAIEFEDYRNIKNGSRLIFEPITTLVGANESGKSNIIRAIQLLSEDFNENDTKMGSIRASRNEMPLLRYFFELKSKDLFGYFKQSIKNFRDKNLICLIVSGETNELMLSDQRFSLREIEYRNQWKNTSGQPMKFKARKGKEIELQQNEKIFGDNDNKFAIAKLARENKITKLTTEEIDSDVIDKIFKDFLPEIEYWEYDQDKHYLPDHVFWDKFLTAPDNFLPVKNLFLIACSEGNLTDFNTALSSFKGKDHEIQKYLDDVSKSLNKIIKKTWKQSNIELQLFYQTDKLRFDIYEGGRRTPPSVRSDGLKWFLSFLLDFRSRGELQNKIILFDQPGEKLHPGGQKELRERFTEIALKNQVIFATQSPFLIDRNSWSKVKFLQRKNGDPEIKQPTKYDVKNDELLRHSLGYSLADVGQANDFNIVVEGYTDQFLLLDIGRRLNEIASYLEKKPIINLNKIAIFDSRGFTTIKKRVDELLQANLHAIGLYDGDDVSKKRFSQDRKSKRFRNLLFSLDEIVDQNNYKTIEDLVPERLWEKSCKEYFKKNRSKLTKKNFCHPRWGKIKEWYKNNYNTEITRKEKESLWEVIFDNWDQYFDSVKDISKISEINITKQALESLAKKVARGKNK
ncbi:MAG TPA: hypothetical protein ENI19_03625 [Candidatus Nealsonbacteria bacterium]|uniref:ATPase AAA-type core domain-containing protein n=1 Tax=marine sediment metagenome TaxID=412755 RepID=A0A0F9VFR2_9ZZZZ|nr:hypothetical protein [Candidatus Nealsonbacteria bacterium]HEB46766.1 hypothetical protein [Candidatus Nealsonbacteria bacterium]